MIFVLSFFIPHLSNYWCLGKAERRKCDVSWVSSIIFWLYEGNAWLNGTTENREFGSDV